MKTRDDSTPAFPNPRDFTQRGMSLRDYFAAKAMQSILASGSSMQQVDLQASLNNLTVESVLAAVGYKFADAMMEARK